MGIIFMVMLGPLFNGTYQTTIYTFVEGNVYLIRYTDTYNSKFSRLVKFKILAYKSGVLTIRYKLLSESEYQRAPNNSKFVNSRMTVMYGKDFLSHSINMVSGKPGSGYCNTNENSICNAGSDFDYNNYRYETFSAGIEGSVIGGVINITSDIKYSDDYASIYYDNETKTIKKYSTTINGSYEIMNGYSKSYALVSLANTYVIRDHFYEYNGPLVDKISKLVVVDYKPDEYVVFRWDLMYPLYDNSTVANSSSLHPHFHPIIYDPVVRSNTHSGELIVTIIVWIFAALSIVVLILDCVIKNRRAHTQIITSNDIVSNTIHSDNL